MVSLDDIGGNEGERGEPMPTVENLIASPDPKPNDELEDSEIAEYLRDLLRKNMPAHRRVMLSYARRVGNLADAVEDYLADLQTQALDNIRKHVPSAKRSPQSLRRLFIVEQDDESPAA